MSVALMSTARSPGVGRYRSGQPDASRPEAYRAYRMILAKSSGSREAPAHQAAVDLGHRHQIGDVPGFMLPP